jgi:hypothetical protein
MRVIVPRLARRPRDDNGSAARLLVAMTETPAGLPPEVLDRMRRGVPLVLTAGGAFLWGEEPITHERVIEALRAGLDVTEAGEATTAIGPQWCYLKIEDTPLRVVAVTADAHQGAPILRLDDGREVPLDPSTLWEEPALGLRCTVPAQRSGRALAARFTNRGQSDLARWIDLEREPPHLVIGDVAHPIRDRP